MKESLTAKLTAALLIGSIATVGIVYGPTTWRAVSTRTFQEKTSDKESTYVVNRFTGSVKKSFMREYLNRTPKVIPGIPMRKTGYVIREALIEKNSRYILHTRIDAVEKITEQTLSRSFLLEIKHEPPWWELSFEQGLRETYEK